MKEAGTRQYSNIIHHVECDKRHGFRFLPHLKMGLKFFLSDRMVHYVQFLRETVNTFLTGVERSWQRGMIYFCIKWKLLYWPVCKCNVFTVFGCFVCLAKT